MGAGLQSPTRAGVEEKIWRLSVCVLGTGRAGKHKVFQGQLDTGEEKWAPPTLMEPLK